MALNPTKSVAILFGTSQKLKYFSSLNSCNVAGTEIQLSDKLKILRATLDSNLTIIVIIVIIIVIIYYLFIRIIATTINKLTTKYKRVFTSEKAIRNIYF